MSKYIDGETEAREQLAQCESDGERMAQELHAKDSTISALHAQLAAAQEALRRLASAAENFAAYAEGEHGVGRGSADEDDHNIIELQPAIDGARQALSSHPSPAMLSAAQGKGAG